MTAGAATLETRGLHVSFGRAAVLRDVDITVPAHTAVGLVGESGSGKSTLGKTVVGIHRPRAGRVLVHGEDVFAAGRRRRAAMRRQVQYIPQDPFSSLSPRRIVGQTLAEALDPVRARPSEHEQAIVGALEQASDRPVAFTHTNLREFFDSPRNKPADLVRALVANGGVVGANAFHGTTPHFDIEVPAPNPVIAGLEGSVDMPGIATGLRGRGYRDDDVAKVMGGNWLRLYEAGWG